MIILMNNNVQIETINLILIRWLQQKWSAHSEALDNEMSESLNMHSPFVSNNLCLNGLDDQILFIKKL